MLEVNWSLGAFEDPRLDKGGAMLLERMVGRGEVCLRRLGAGRRPDEVRFGRFLANDKVTLERLIEGWAGPTAAAVAGRHVLAIQDTTELSFKTSAERGRGLGEIGKGVGRGLLLQAMLALDAHSLACLGLVAGEVWTRPGRVSVPHRKRPLEAKESRRWVATAAQAETILCEAVTLTTIADQESDLYAYWAMPRRAGVHRLGRAYCNRALVGGNSLHRAAAAWPVAGRRTLTLKERADRPARVAHLELRFGTVTLKRPKGEKRSLPDRVVLTLVEVIERAPPEGAEPVHWRLLTTHAVEDVAMAWQIVDWYSARWIVEQLWRLLKKQGLRLEDSQIETADRLLKLTAIAVRAAVVTLQLTQARDGHSAEPASVVFEGSDIEVLERLHAGLEGKSEKQTNPHPKPSLAWASWIIARLGGWDGYASSKPPGPITFKHGLDYFRVLAKGWRLRDPCIP
jgi:hypothetical protein